MFNNYKFLVKIICYVSFLIIIIGGSLILKNKFYPKSAQAGLTLLFKDNQATDALVRLLGMTGIRIQGDTLQPDNHWPEAKLVLSSRSLEEITRAVQGKIRPEVTWLIPPTQERWQTQGLRYINFSKEQAYIILNLVLKELKMGEEITPLRSKYEGILFLGSTLKNVRERLNLLNNYIEKERFTFEEIWALTGERSLDPTVGETFENLLDPKGSIPLRTGWKKTPEMLFPTSEEQMVEWVFKQSCSNRISLELVKMVHAPKEEGRKRATTKTTVEAWLKENPKGGNYLAVSTQPFGLYQLLVLRHHVLAKGRVDILIDVIAAKFPFSTYTHQSEEKLRQFVNIALDNIAKICYELVEIEKLRA